MAVAKIWLVLVISVDQLDLLAKHAAAKILNRHFRGFNRPLAVKIGIDPGLIVEDADLDALRRGWRACKRSAYCNAGGRQLDYPRIPNHIPLLVRRLAAPVKSAARSGPAPSAHSDCSDEISDSLNR
jgi:hypothetical protein